MIISLRNHRALQEDPHRPCADGTRDCPAAGNVVAAMFRSMTTNNYLHQQNKTLKFRLAEDQTQNAFIYVAVVVVFYAAIIILLLGTNGRRKRHHRRQPTRHFRQLTKRPTLAVLEGLSANASLMVRTTTTTEQPQPDRDGCAVQL